MKVDEQRDEFLQQRNSARQMAYDLAEVVRRVDPVACKIDPAIWEKAAVALRKVDLGRGIGGYQFPIASRDS